MTDKNKHSEGEKTDAALYRPMTRRRAAKQIGVIALGVVLPLVITLAPTEARAQFSPS